MSIPVVTVGPGQEDIVSGLERLRGPVTVVRRCSELAELLAACQSGLAAAAVVAEGSGELTGTLVERMQAAGVSIVALTDDPLEASRLRSIGVVPAPLAIDARSLASSITDAVDSVQDRFSVQTVLHAGFSDAVSRAPVRAAATPSVTTAAASGAGRILAVWGPAGSPGRTLLAVNIAAELAATGKSVVLVDADTYGASVSVLLGLLDESAGLAQACRMADQGVLDDAALDRASLEVFTKSGSFRVLTGTTRADRWIELRASALSKVLERAREKADTVVVDTGFCLEADEELSFDSMAPRRNAATLRSLEVADEVIAVGAADAIGMPRLVRGLAELAQAVPDAAPRVVLNKVRRSSVGRSPRKQLGEAWQRFGPTGDIEAFLPADSEACDAALLSGSVLLECAPDSALRLAIARLVCADFQQNRTSAGRSTRAMRLLTR